MCGKFTAMASYAEVHAFHSFFTKSAEEHAAEQDQEVTFRVMSNLPLLVWDKEAQERKILHARWGFPQSHAIRVEPGRGNNHGNSK